MPLILSLLFLLILFSGCGCRRCPDDSTSISPALPWNPPFIAGIGFADSILGDEYSINLESSKNKRYTLEELLDIAMDYNPKTKYAWRNARAAYFNLGATKSQCYPTINSNTSLDYINRKSRNRHGATNIPGNASGNAGEISSSNPTGFSTGSGSSISRSITQQIAFSYLLLDFGGRAASITAAREALFSTNLIHNRVIQDVMIDVLNNYYLYIYTKEALKAKEDDIANAEKSLAAAKGMYEAGVKPKVDMLQAQSNLLKQQLDSIELKGRTSINLASLVRAVGPGSLTSSQIPELPEKLPVDTVGENLDYLIATAREERADLAAAYTNYLQNRANIVVARSAGLPVLTANAEVDRTWFFGGPISTSRTYAGSLELNFPLFAGYLYQNRTMQARELAEAAIAQIEDKQANIDYEVVQSYFNFKTAEESIKFAEEYLKFSQEAYDIALGSYKNGVGTILDVLQTQAALSSARLQLIQARTQWLIALANISYAIGDMSTLQI